jgi:hypothetical protein
VVALVALLQALVAHRERQVLPLVFHRLEVAVAVRRLPCNPVSMVEVAVAQPVVLPVRLEQVGLATRRRPRPRRAIMEETQLLPISQVLVVGVLVVVVLLRVALVVILVV